MERVAPLISLCIATRMKTHYLQRLCNLKITRPAKCFAKRIAP
jgi:hypothetical protein